MKHIDILNAIMRIDTNKETFDIQAIENRRFMFNPKTGTLILGVQFKGGEMLFSHAEEYHRLGIREDFEKFVRGWVGTGKGYKHGVIHFAPNVPASVPELFDKAYDTLMMFRRNNANAKTVVRGFGRTWEQPLGNIITERQVDLMEDKTAVNYKTDTVDPPKSVPAAPIELSGKTQKEKITEITTKLEQGIKDLFASDKFKEYFSAMSKLHRYSFRNSLLIFMQKPDASMVAGYTSWQKNFKRQVRKGEHGIKIFAPAPYKATKEVERIDKATNQRVIGKDGKPMTDTVEYTVPAFRDNNGL